MSDERGTQGFERRVADLLDDAASEVPPDLDLRPRIYGRLYAAQSQAHPVVRPNAPAPIQSSRGRGLGRRRTAIAGGLVAALVVFSAFAFARPLMLSWFGDNSLREVALQDGTVINRSVTDQGVTIHLEEGYADAARTVLTMQISGGDKRHPADPYLPDLRLVDAAGNSYTSITGDGFNNDWLFEFLPLPASALGAEQSLILSLDQMQQTTDGPNYAVTTFAGSWQIPFQLHPQPGRIVSLDVAPQTHGGIMLQPTQLELAPAGVRLTVRMSGLPPDTSLFSLTHFQHRLTEIAACPPGGHVCGVGGSGTSDGALMQLIGSDGQTMVPAWIAVTSPAPQPGVPIGRQVVGPSGTAELEFLFFVPLHATAGTARADFDAVRLAPANPNADERIIPGPWTFGLPLN